MSIALPTNRSTATDLDGPQRFVISNVDWAFYEEVCRQLEGRHAFVTFYKGRLEVAPTSMLHELLSNLLSIMVGVLAEELDVEIVGAGRATLRRPDLKEGVEPDVSFYIGNQSRLVGRDEINLSIDPPPDLAIEIEVTRRLGTRRSIYQDMGVPEIWVYNESDGLNVLWRQSDGAYAPIPLSASFPPLTPADMTTALRAGQTQGQTTFTKAFRQRVRDAIATRSRQV
jgi:Uma2 family endonuclease